MSLHLHDRAPVYVRRSISGDISEQPSKPADVWVIRRLYCHSDGSKTLAFRRNL